MFMLPQTVEAFSWTRSTTRRSLSLAVIGFAGIWYAVSARKWFKGPKIQGSAEELAEIERELSI